MSRGWPLLGRQPGEAGSVRKCAPVPPLPARPPSLLCWVGLSSPACWLWRQFRKGMARLRMPTGLLLQNGPWLPVGPLLCALGHTSPHLCSHDPSGPAAPVCLLPGISVYKAEGPFAPSESARQGGIWQSRRREPGSLHRPPPGE